MLSLVGTIVGDSQSVALFLEKNSQEMVRLSAGESHQGWVLSSVHGREALLEKGDRKETVTLPSPDGGAGAAAPSGAPAMPGAQATPPPKVPTMSEVREILQRQRENRR